MPPHVAHVVAVRGEELSNDALRLPAVGAFEVAVLEQRHGRIVGAANVVAIGVDVLHEVEDVLGGPSDLPRP